MDMEILGFIFGLVAIISLAEYASTKNWQSEFSTLRNSLVFEHRNQKYGAYQIRQGYNKTMMMILFSLVSSVGLSYGIFIWSIQPASDLPTDLFDETQVEVTFPPDDVVEVPEIAIEQITQQEKLANQLDFQQFVITDNEVSTTINTQDNVTNQVLGNENVFIDDQDEQFNPPIDKMTTIIDKNDEVEIPTIVDVDAEYPGGYKEMVKFLSSQLRYPEHAIQQNIEGSARMRFVVEKDGSIKNIEVVKGVPDCQECDLEAKRVILKMPNWKAGENNGKKVRSYFTMAITFKLTK